MELSVNAFPAPITKNSTIVSDDGSTQRRSANFHPSIWGYHFLAYDNPVAEDVKTKQQIQQLKEEVREIIVATLAAAAASAADKSSHDQLINLIDSIQRLGVAYHFEIEIETALQHLYKTYHDRHDHQKTTINGEDNDNDDGDDLYAVSLSFRLLRQQGHPVSCDVFNKFKNNKGEFLESLTGDVRGMLSLYEATHLRVHGEDILDEALDFTTTHLNSAQPNLSNPLGAQVDHALNQPIHTGLTRLESRRYIVFYEQADGSHNNTLLDFAKLDFNLLQKLHQRELSEITRWWKDLDFARKLPFARDRLVECYFWILGVCFEPQYVLARRILTKVITLASIMDDIYDVYGTLEELVLFTDAIERWEISALDQLPEYLKLYYQALLDVYNMIDEEITKEGRSYCVDYAKSAMKNLARAYFEEAKWFHEGYVPSYEEYMRVALVSGGYKMLITTSFVGTGEVVNKQAFEWASNDPLIVQAASVICRLMDDMVSHKFEQERGDVASAIECYMKQHGATEKEATAEFHKQVTNAWKDMNAECLRPTATPMPLLVWILNLARVSNVMYKGEDVYTHSGTRLKEFVTSVFIDPVTIN